MGITRITSFVTSDGKRFNNEDSASEHQMRLDEIARFCSEHGRASGRSSSAARNIIMAWEEWKTAIPGGDDAS